MGYINTDEDGFTGTIILNNDAKHNSLNHQMLEEIVTAIDSFEKKNMGNCVKE